MQVPVTLFASSKALHLLWLPMTEQVATPNASFFIGGRVASDKAWQMYIPCSNVPYQYPERQLPLFPLWELSEGAASGS